MLGHVSVLTVLMIVLVSAWGVEVYFEKVALKKERQQNLRCLLVQTGRREV